MASNYTPEDTVIAPSIKCVHDSTTAFSADFSVNGNVDDWEYFDGIHTYGAWGGFLFGTLYTNTGVVGRYNVFIDPIDANTHYFVRITMKYNPATRATTGIHPLPTQGKIRWRTLSDAIWDSRKEKYFDLEADNNWHTYILNMGPEQWWQGDVNDLRVWPAADDAEDGDEFFIRAIDIFSSEASQCNNQTCEKYLEYSSPCPWVGQRATRKSAAHASGTQFSIDDMSEFIININGYGNEIVKVKEVLNGSGQEAANALAKAISRTGIGGYSEVQVEYTEDEEFKIYSGTITTDSSVVVIDTELARYLQFFDSAGNDISISTAGVDPVDGYSPLSNFKVRTSQVLSLFDNNERTGITFNPFQYSVEGGRRDWLESGVGTMTTAIGDNDGDYSGQVARAYSMIDNAGKTIVDYNHPFNASGRITAIEIMCTLDTVGYSKSRLEADRKSEELSGAKVMVVRPKRDGTLDVIHTWSLDDRDTNRTYGDELYSLTQEAIKLDVDVFVNKGDMLAIYNANMYTGFSISGNEYDCQYYQVDGEAVGNFDPGLLNGDGSAGLLVYAHGDEPQNRLYLDIDLRNRYNIENIEVTGLASNNVLEYNIARCLDINWQCELFGLQHWTQHDKLTTPGTFRYQRPNTYYGLDRLSDGIYTVLDGLACDSFSLTYDNSTQYTNLTAGPGVVPVNPYYFWINGDEEWLAVWLHAQWFQVKQAVTDFDYDPIAFYIHFPFEKEKSISKCKIYFKEKYNFRSFAMSTYQGFYYNAGDADDYRYDLIPAYTNITLDGVEYNEDSPTYDTVAEYLFKNPCTGHMIKGEQGRIIYEWDPILSDAVQDFGGGHGYFTSQSFTVANSEEWTTARRVDWQIIEHEWEPISCKGFRIYCDFHKSTKITEMELYGEVQDIGSNLSGGIVMTFSEYEEVWWPTESSQETDSLVNIFVGESPRYLTLELIPVTETRYDDVAINIKTDDLYAGPKGCEYVYYADHAKTNTDNAGQLIEVKNTYGQPYDLYVDIAPGTLYEKGLIYFSRLNNAAAISNPVIGPDGNYYKLYDYSIRNQDYNCAINCETYGLNDLIDGAEAYYSRNDGVHWDSYGTLTKGTSIDFSNRLDISRSILKLPVLSRNRYWKIGAQYPINVRDIDVYYDDVKLTPEYYHDVGLAPYSGPISDHAPHVDNGSITGSYYTLEDDDRLGIDLGDQENIDTVVFWHDEFECDVEAIDEWVHLYLIGNDLQDHSYHAQPISLVGYAAVDTTTSGLNLGKGSIYFDGDPGSYLTCPHTEGFNLGSANKSLDLFIKFEEYPAVGEEAVFIQNWGAGGEHWKAALYNNAGTFQLRFYVNTGSWSTNWTPGINVWNHIAFGFGSPGNPYPSSEKSFFINGGVWVNQSSGVPNYGGAVNDIIIGKGFKGWISHLRWSKGTDWGSSDFSYCGSKAARVWNGPSFPAPTETAVGKYTFEIYSSPDNITFGLYATVNMFGVVGISPVDAYFIEGSEVDTDYYNYFAIDLGQRYDLDIVRSYGANDAYDFMGEDDISYSADDISDINSVNFTSTSGDARWLRINLFANDDTDRDIRKIGVFPKIDRVPNPAEDSYNHTWTSLGSSVTNYSTGTNVALGATTSGSSYLGDYIPANVVDGVIDNERSHAWLSDNTSEQWVSVDLGEAKDIYRVKIYHGYSTEDDDFLAEDYRVETSLDNQSFTTIFDITGNTEFTRTHDLAESVSARYVRIYITGYKADNIFEIKDNDLIGFYKWEGACMREVEIYEDYGFSIISSEEWPIISINLGDQFYIQGHSLEGAFGDVTRYDWNNASSNFAWSDSVLSEVKKVAFGSWGDSPGYEQWVAIKRDTATYHNADPAVDAGIGDYGVDYLKHALIESHTKENPVNYPWWWSSSISTLSRDYDSFVELCTNALRIDYPASTALDTVQFIEGSNWGVDTDHAYRDGFSFRWYIEDVDKLDTSEGYIFFGGLDGTSSPQVVEYRWNLSTLSGSLPLQAGWNVPFLRFREAEEIIYNENANPFDDEQPLMREYTTWQTAGLKFRGKGEEFHMLIDGFVLKRNHFADSSKFDYGLYLNGPESMDFPLNDIDMDAGTIEFWLRPDYNFEGTDEFRRFRNRCLFHFGNVANDVFGCMISSNGINIYHGNLAGELSSLVIQGIFTSAIDSLFHIAVAFSANGKNLDSDSSTIKFYINNFPVATNYGTWTYTDEKLFRFTLGGKTPLAVIEQSSSLENRSIDAVVSNLRIYNYCKSNFTDSMNNVFDDNAADDLVIPSEMIEISQDNVTYYRVGDAELPFFYSKVPDGDTKQIYVRSAIPEGLSGKENRTAGIVTSWDVGV